ncbi:GrpE-domain-containing protein [Thozetella sp. PMI_491]|nr:GrpE-domain-containing protein [Thozetella sp. PMI_491]
MFRQALSGPSRALGSSLRSAAQRSSLRPQFRPVLPVAAASRAAPLRTARWYSSESEPAKDAAAEGDKAKESPEDALKKQLEAKDAEVRDWKDKYLRSVADFRNLQDRTTRDMKQARDFAIQKFAKDLVDSVDNLDRALATVPATKVTDVKEVANEFHQDLVSLYEGLKMTENILLQTLQKHGLERFDPNGEKFNPNEHEATFMTPMADKEENTVFHTQQKGFKLNGRVLRAAKVGVVKNK